MCHISTRKVFCIFQSTLGIGRNILPGPGPINFEISILKDFPVYKDVPVQFRAEFFNAFNTPPLGLPRSSLGSPNFWVITSAGGAREIQFVLKILF